MAKKLPEECVMVGGRTAQVDSDTFHFGGKKLPEMRTGAMLSRKGVFFWDVVPKIAKSNYVWVILKAKIYFDCRE